jgi:putative Mg2+ transporter-C (MgtC) family protein
MVSPFEIEIIGKLLMAAVLGTVIGLEREMHRKPAGMRTHALVCIGATLFTIMSTSMRGEFVDTSRIAASVVLGIGFLGAGTIFMASDRVKGLTTAAELWVLAAIGLAIGAGLYSVALVTTFIVLAVLAPGKLMEKKLEKEERSSKRR